MRVGKLKVNTIQGYREVDVRGKTEAASYGAGAIGTVFAPKKYQWLENGHIITEIHVDLTGLGVHGAHDHDAIGLAAGGACYLDRYVTSTHGVCYKVEAVCLELPAAASGTIQADINLSFNASAVLEYSGAAGAEECNFGGMAAGCSYVVTTPGLTADDYMYMVEESTAASTGVYGAGMLIFRMYGHPVLAA